MLVFPMKYKHQGGMKIKLSVKIQEHLYKMFVYVYSNFHHIANVQ